MTQIHIPKYHDEIIAMSKATHEKVASEQLIIFAVNNHMQNHKNYLPLWEYYIQSVQNYNKTKNIFYNKVIAQYITPNTKEWYMDFEREVLKLYDLQA